MRSNKRLSDCTNINQEKPLNFIFNGKKLQGFEGDTLASALIANGITLVGRSFKYHRPRGIMAAGSEEANALVQLEPNSAKTLANIQATKIKLYEGLKAESVNCWPSPSLDLMAINSLFHKILPAGFYYKTFMWPAKAWKFYEYFIRRAAGLGKAPNEADPDIYDKINIYCDVLIIGGGPAGLAATLAAGKTGARTILVDEQPNLGGQLLRESFKTIDPSILKWIQQTEINLKNMQEVTILKETTAFGFYEHNFVGLIETKTPSNIKQNNHPRQRMWRVHPKEIILATGAIERPLIFADNDRPGVMLANAYRAYTNQYGIIPEKEIVIFTNNDDAYRTAIDLHAIGVKIPAIIDIRTNPDGDLPTIATKLGINILENTAITNVVGTQSIKAIDVMTLNENGDGLIGVVNRIKCNGIASSGGWNPAIHLHSQSGGKATYNKERGIYIPDSKTSKILCVGAIMGDFNLSKCFKNGVKVGKIAASKAGFKKITQTRVPNTNDIEETPHRILWVIPTNLSIGQRGKHFLDLQNDVTVTDIQLAAREGYTSIEHTKRYTTLGMATDQGKTGNILGMATLAQSINAKDPGEVGTTTFRPPYTPVTIGAFAGRNVNQFSAPIRKTPIHFWHEKFACEWEDVGDWKRPWYYKKTNETMQESLNRECLSARTSIGILDSSTLGKIDIQGPDAATFLDRIYTNSWKKLKIGSCRYGIMLSEDGMVLDDGVTSRLGQNHYFMTTTTGNAAKILEWLEEWLQTEWPSLKVYCNSVTEHWASLSICGPKAQSLLAEFNSNIDFSPKNFPPMTVKKGEIAGIQARIFRISFTGEPTYEINVPANYGLSLWTQLINAGEKYGITPYGTESMHILRAEKGFIIVGQETDGTVTPTDLGMDWILSKKKDFIGKRSLTRYDTARKDRKHLVGLIAHQKDTILPEGGQILDSPDNKSPMTMLGHITSSYYSPNVNSSIALALIKNGRQRKGDKIYVHSNGAINSAEITSPCFFDPTGDRLNG